MSKQRIVICSAAILLCSCAPKTTPAPSAAAVMPPEVTRTADENHEQCGETVCQYGEVCKDEQCKTRFEMNVYLAPIPKEGEVTNDSYDYWECKSETCTYRSNRIYTIPKGLRVREDQVYCGGEGIKLSQMKDYTCTEQGWVCSSPNGCADCEAECRYQSCVSETCNPGDKCMSGCVYVGGLEGVFKCEEGDCECGTRRCGKNQICAYGNCYFGGEIRNDFGDCEFKEEWDICGTGDPPAQIISYTCPKRCSADIPPKVQDSYEYIRRSMGDCHGVDIGLWMCTSEDGCACGDTRCSKGVSCIDGKCVLLGMYDNDMWNGRYGYECATEFPDALSYQPKVPEHYHIVKAKSYPYNEYWMCDETNECICDGRKLPPNMVCHGKKDGSEYMSYIPEYGDYIVAAPKNMDSYKFEKHEWICENDECLCGGKRLPKNANCINDTIYCHTDEIPEDMRGYECSNDDKDWHARWICPSGKCMCGGVELPPGVKCFHAEGKDYYQCGYRYFTSKTAVEYDCIDGLWVVKVEEGQRHCQNKLLPVGAKCVFGNDLQEYAVCGGYELSEWDDYRCENDEWKCALKDKPCVCHGKPLPEGARCFENEAYCGSESLTSWVGLVCRNKKWVDEKSLDEKDLLETSSGSDKDELCYGHKLAKGVICPTYDDRDNYVKKDGEHGLRGFNMADQESCEDVGGCVCHDKLCPPSGVCTPQGCIDPVTDTTFELKDGYLVSGQLRQCAHPDGCSCGDQKVEHQEYCYHDKPYLTMKSCVSDKKRVIGENNYTPYDCENWEVPWKNECSPDSEIDPTQYIVKDCLVEASAFYSDRSVAHHFVNVCMQHEGCQCIHNTCKYGEACYKGQCVADYPCHELSWYGIDEKELGKCKVSDSEDEGEEDE